MWHVVLQRWCLVDQYLWSQHLNWASFYLVMEYVKAQFPLDDTSVMVHLSWAKRIAIGLEGQGYISVSPKGRYQGAPPHFSWPNIL